MTTNSGAVLAIAQGNASTADNSAYTLVVRRSVDGGASWSPISIIYEIAQPDLTQP